MHIRAKWHIRIGRGEGRTETRLALCTHFNICGTVIQRSSQIMMSSMVSSYPTVGKTPPLQDAVKEPLLKAGI